MGKRDLRGRVVAITGASSGIGAATAVACGRKGMRVGLMARREDRLQAVAYAVREAGGEAEVVPGDVRDRAAVECLVEAVVRRWARLDAVVANAGFGVAAPVAETPPEEAREIFDVNVLGTVWAIQAAWPVFREQGSGHVVVVSSASAWAGLPGSALYSATKAAQTNLAEGLRIEAEAIGADVSVVHPVVTDTEFRTALRDHTSGGSERARARVGGPRQSAEEVASAILDCLERPRFLVTPYAPARLLPWLEAISPRLTARVLRYPEYYRRQTKR
ncbi:MAG TPA: SDR family NAD(P)-dependent oxidoreductase [Gemmatimonadota bacterium]|nr:SDR family NAD(P)-dependent oxidoreductase [Gemmatimonadota bacterium]